MPKDIDEQYNFNNYISKVLKQVHPSAAITIAARNQVNLLLHQVLDDLVRTMETLRKSSGATKTISSRTVMFAVRMIFPGEIAKHSVSELTKSVTKYLTSESGVKGSPKTKASRAGLQFPPSRIENILRTLLPHVRLAESAPVAVAGVLEYLAAEILELAGNAARDSRRTRLTMHHIFYAISLDEELAKMFRNTTFGTSVVRNVHRLLLPGPKQPKYSRNVTFNQWKQKQQVPYTIDEIRSMNNSQITRVCKEYTIHKCSGSLEQRQERLINFFRSQKIF